MSRVCVIGSANVDYTVALPRLPSPGETVSGGALLVNLPPNFVRDALLDRGCERHFASTPVVVGLDLGRAWCVVLRHE